MRRLLRSRPRLGMAILSTVSTIVGIVIVLLIDWFPEQGSTAAKDIDTLYDVLLIASVPIFVGVMAVAFYSVFAWRAKPGDMSDGEPIHGNTKLEIIWVTIPFIMVSALAIYGWVVLNDIEARASDPLRVEVRGQQFAWRFEYPDDGKVKSEELVVPKGRQVEFLIHTDDVLHSFWVPEFRLKTDAVPNLTTRVRVTPTREGRYSVVCAELCGVGHSTMRQVVRVVPEQEFADWLAEESGGGGDTASADDPNAAGRALFKENGCDACHTLSDAQAAGSTGPALDDIRAQAQTLADDGDTAADYVRTSITDPSARVADGFNDVMPKTYGKDLSDEEIDSLVKYLLAVGKAEGQ